MIGAASPLSMPQASVHILAVGGRRHSIGERDERSGGLCGAAIAMMEPAEHRLGNNITDRFDAAGEGRVAVEGEVSPRPVVVVDVLAQDATQMILAEGDDVVRALATDAADDALDEGVLPRRSLRADDLLDAEGLHSFAEGFAEDRVPVTMKEPGLLAARKRLDELVGSPCGRRVRGDVEVPDAAPVMREHDEDVEDLEGQRRHREEVAGCADRHVVGDETAPFFRVGWSLRRGGMYLATVVGHAT